MQVVGLQEPNSYWEAAKAIPVLLTVWGAGALPCLAVRTPPPPLPRAMVAVWLQSSTQQPKQAGNTRSVFANQLTCHPRRTQRPVWAMLQAEHACPECPLLT